MKGKVLASLFVAASAAGCGGGDSLPTGPSPVAAQVEFQYVLTLPQASSIAEEVPCAGRVLLYPSFWGFSQVTMVPLGSTSFGALFEEIPIGRHSVRVTVPEGCGRGELYANGVPLSDRGSGMSFTLHPDGSVER